MPNYKIDADFKLADSDHAAFDRGPDLQTRDSLRELERATVDAQFNQLPLVRRSVGSGELDLRVLETGDPAPGLPSRRFLTWNGMALFPLTSKHKTRCGGFQVAVKR